MTGQVSLRPVEAHDLPIFFTHQLDPEATRLAAFPSRDRGTFFTHWTTKIIGNPAAANRTILLDDRVAGYIGAWTDAETHERSICYWLGRDFWGRGVASAALRQFLESEMTRPLVARVAKHNRASIRVLEKSGFIRTGDDSFTLPDKSRHEEFVYVFSDKIP